ncbi:NF-kappa-B-repressing factor [Drosophila santomea]|uniref:NF-kappa-B-repressing factor n=1 Tax=Drosophila santomea TaxID=129105 RepID=UPI0019534E1E|nr:NF-kappa-B-repressing factor [Drosophila santomea]
MSVKPKRQKMENEDEETKPKQKKVKAKKQKDAGYGSGEFSLDWDVDSYKTEYESDEHWDLRRSFMLAHKDRFEEDRLVCLAQTFVNMEFMGCKYPSATMLLVAELSKEIAADFRQKREQRLKRTFVSASDAAEQRAKGRRAAPVPSAGSPKERQCFGGGDPVDLYQDLRFGKLIVYLAGGRNCLQNSCNIANVKYEERASLDQPVNDNKKYAELLVNNEVIATGQGETLKAAKQAAHKQACMTLQSHCYSIKLNASRDTIKVEKNKDGVNINVTKESADSQSDPKLDASNKGYRMMRLMGWTGGGLGRLKQGREDPVGYLLKSNRNGLGLINQSGNIADYRRLIENYVRSDDIRDMQFEPTFSKEERTKFHQIARQFSLRSNSYGSGESRRLLITKKISYGQILTEVLFRRNPKFCERYFVHVPMQKAHLFPGHVADLELENVGE